MNILITGALGVLGRPLMDELRSRGHQVTGCDVRHSDDPDVFRADVADYRQLNRAFWEAAPDVVYHLAGEFGRHNGEAHYEDVWRTNTTGTRNVLELCKVHDARLIFASSSEIYGECEEELLSEDLPERRVLWQPNEYALSKWANEVQIVNFQRRHGVHAVRCRFFNVYGREPYHPYRSVVSLFCHRLLRGEPIDVYEGYRRSFLYIDDFTPTLANVCEREHNGVYNIGGRDHRSIEELAEIVVKATGADPALVRRKGEDRFNVRSKQADIARAEKYLGHDPTTKLEEGVPLTVEWMRERC